MVSGKEWTIINVSLAFIAILLVFPLIDFKLPIIGEVVSAGVVDKQGAICAVSYAITKEWNDIDHCCLEARKQLRCSKEKKLEFDGKTYHWTCQTGEGKVLKYHLNSKAYNYCKQQSIWKRY